MPKNELFIGGLDRNCNQSDLENVFDKYGKIVRCSVKNSASGAVFAFIEFEDENSAEDALTAENGREMNGASMTVEFAKGKNDRGGGRGGFRGGDRGYRGGGGGGFRGGGGYGGGGDRYGGGRGGGGGGGYRGGRGGRGGGGGGGDRNCYQCGEPGHIARDCRQGGGGGSRGSGGGYRGERRDNGGGGGGRRSRSRSGSPN